MDGLEKVVWAEGVFLGQQHFQVWDRYLEQSSYLRAKGVSPFLWGFLDCKIDQEALANGQFRLKACDVILPDGRLVVFREPAELPLLCDLQTAPTDRVELYLSLPANAAVSGVAGYNGRSQLAAWQAGFVHVADQHDPARVREVMLARPNLVLLRGDEPREQFVSIKVAEVQAAGDGGWRLVENYIPTVCRSAASAALNALIGRVFELLQARVRVLAERRAGYGRLTDFGPSELSQFLLLQTLRPPLAMLQHLRSHPDIHPERLYCELAALLVAVRGFCPEAPDDDTPGYVHADLGATFHRLEAMLRAALAEAVPSQMAGYKFRRENDALYSVDSLDSRLLERSSLFLAVQHDADGLAWVADFARQAKVGGREDIELIISSALPGVGLSHTQRPPSRLPVKSGYEYFRIEARGEFWERACEQQSLALYLPHAFTGAKVELLTVEE